MNDDFKANFWYFNMSSSVLDSLRSHLNGRKDAVIVSRVDDFYTNECFHVQGHKSAVKGYITRMKSRSRNESVTDRTRILGDIVEHFFFSKFEGKQFTVVDNNITVNYIVNKNPPHQSGAANVIDATLVHGNNEHLSEQEKVKVRPKIYIDLKRKSGSNFTERFMFLQGSKNQFDALKKEHGIYAIVVTNVDGSGNHYFTISFYAPVVYMTLSNLKKMEDLRLEERKKYRSILNP